MIAHEVTIFSTQFTHNISHLAACVEMRRERTAGSTRIQRGEIRKCRANKTTQQRITQAERESDRVCAEVKGRGKKARETKKEEEEEEKRRG